MAHETAHVVQQRAATGPSPTVQRFIGEYWEKAKQFVADIKNSVLAQVSAKVPGYELFTVLIAYDPLTNEAVDRTPAALLEGIFDLFEPAQNVYEQLRENELVTQAVEWIDENLPAIDPSEITELFAGALRQLRESPTEVTQVIGRVTATLATYYSQLKTFAKKAVLKAAAFLKETLIEKADETLGENDAWMLFKKVVGKNPLTGEELEPETAELIRDFLRLIGKEQHLEQLDREGVIEETAAWLDGQIERFQTNLSELQTALKALWEALTAWNFAALPDLFVAVTTKAVGIFDQVVSFAGTVAEMVLKYVKEAVLTWLREQAASVPGYDLLTVIIGFDPFTGVAVPRTGERIVRGFLELLPGGEEIYAKFVEGGIIGKAVERILTAMESLGITKDMIVTLFSDIWTAVSITDLAEPLALFERLKTAFGEPLAKLGQFVSVVLRELIFAALELMNFPTELVGSIITNAMTAITDIRADPVGFLLNLLGAVKLGFQNFFANILSHLGSGLVDWLFRGLRKAGVEPPKDLSLASILEFALDVLGITTEKLWEKLAARIGDEKVAAIRGAIDKLTGIWTFVSDVQERGMAAIWEYIRDKISGLWETILEKARSWILETIITKVTTKLLTMLDPTGVMAVINGFIAFFDAVQSAVEYITDILGIINDYVSTVAAIAKGSLDAGAAKLEQALANAIPIAIGFLAKQVGIDDIGTKIKEIVTGVRGVVDKALDSLIDKAVTVVDKVLRTAVGAVGIDPWWDLSKPVELPDGKHTLRFEGDETDPELVLRSTRKPLQQWLTNATAALEKQKTDGQIDSDEYSKNKTALAEIQTHATEIEQIKDKTGGSFGKGDGERIRTLFAAISDEMAKLTFKGFQIHPPESVLLKQLTRRVSNPPSEIGMVMVAQPLSTNPGGLAGSKPIGIQSAIFAQVTRDRPNTYVQGHLLNHNLHGSGSDTKNLAPITGDDNKRMSREIEEPVKAAVLDENQVVSYRVQFTYGQHSGANLTEFEKELPTKIHAQAIGMRPVESVTSEAETKKAQNWELDRDTTVLPTKSFDVSMPKTSVNVVTISRLSLTTDLSSITDIDQRDLVPAVLSLLQTVPNIGPTLAERIVDAMPFSDPADLESVLGVGPEIAASIRDHGVIHESGRSDIVQS